MSEKRLTLIFSGNDFKYELEGVCKLFFPVESFNFLFLDSGGGTLPEDGSDCCLITRLEGRRSTLISVAARIGGRIKTAGERLDSSSDELEKSCEFRLGRLLYRVLSELTGKRPEWGVLTGVRPVKLINKLRGSGLDFDGIRQKLTEEYLVTEEKVRIGYETAVNQDAAVSGMPKDSFSLYVSIPFCPTRCSYCSFVSQTVSSFKKLMPEYVERLCDEIAYTSGLLGDGGPRLDTVYFGGGTPTSLEPGQLDRIMKTIASLFDLSGVREYTVEAGRPDTVTYDKLMVIKENGGGRISVNPQTVHDSVLLQIGRRHTAAQFFESYSLARSVGFKAINVDLIAGLPGDSISGFKESVDRIIELSPENITVHALSVKRASDMMASRDIGDDSLTESMIAYATQRLLLEGYKPYYLYRQKNQLGNQENIGWTRPGLEGIYNINIMEEIQSIVAVGAGGTTKILSGTDPGKGIQRFFNPKYPLDYIRSFDTVLKRKETAMGLLLGSESDKDRK